MANIVINTGITDERITSCKIYRSHDPKTLYDAANLLGTVSGENIGSFTDTKPRDLSKVFNYYGFECSTVGGGTIKSPPRGVINTADAPPFYGSEYEGMFRTGSVAHGILLDDPNGVSIPLRAEFRNWIVTKIPQLSSALTAVPESGVNYVSSFNGEFFIGGSGFFSINGDAATQITALKTVIDAVRANPEEYTITRSGFKWQVTVLTEDELSSTGPWVRGSNMLGGGIFFETNSYSYMLATTIRDENTLVSIKNSSSYLKPNNFFNFDEFTGTQSPGSTYTAITMRYVGQA